MTTPVPADTPGLEPDDVLDVLARGELEVRGRLVDASNATLYAAATLDGVLSVFTPALAARRADETSAVAGGAASTPAPRATVDRTTAADRMGRMRWCMTSFPLAEAVRTA